ncbi:C-type lectin domain family 2 member B [Nomascus leucogenys]|nr:C-type lectin domain family 2 member B [Nomascus leucogenys]
MQGMMTKHKKCVIIGVTLIIITNIITVNIVKLTQDSQSLCPYDWIGFQNKCYYFSKEEGDWNSSKYSCSTQHADLTIIDNIEEMNFLRRYKCSSDHWIGLKMAKNRTGQWVDGATFTKSFGMRGSEGCAYLSEDGAATARCYTERKWICRKKIH